MSDTSLIDVLLTEYEQLKKEQNYRLRTRDYLPVAVLASSGAIVAAMFNFSNRVDLLLLIPVITVILGWIYLTNDEKISSIGKYIRTSISSRISSLLSEPGIFGWENFHRSDSRRFLRKVSQFVIDIFSFGVLPTSALVAFWLTDTYSILLLFVSLFELLLVMSLIFHITVYRDFGRDTYE
jgi:hypothetical protein